MAGPLARYRVKSDPTYRFAHGGFAHSMGKYFGAEVIGDENPVLNKDPGASVEVHFYVDYLVEDGIKYLKNNGLTVEEIK